ncbi:MAG: hypothetical protein OEQ18_01060 [Gammaproteobacteria bacterium]|nr:hypothetical protein [Gammaproteobacteria bacterium]
MGLLAKLFSSQDESYPSLPTDSYATQRVNAVQTELKALVDETEERLEVVPAERAAYVFVGKPPKKFGLAWIHDGKVGNFKTLVEEHGVNPVKLERITDHLREAYERSAEDARYAAQIGQRTVVITPSRELEEEVHKIIDEVLSS